MTILGNGKVSEDRAHLVLLHADAPHTVLEVRIRFHMPLSQWVIPNADQLLLSACWL